MRQDIARVLPPEQYPMGDISAANPDLRGMFDLELERLADCQCDSALLSRRDREDTEYSRLFSSPGYALAINVLLYAMTQ